MSTAIVWLRNDLRLADNPALHIALESHDQVIPLFVLDDHLMSSATAGANRIRFLHEALTQLRDDVIERGGGLVVVSGQAPKQILEFALQCGATQVYAATDFSPYALKRDTAVALALKAQSITLNLMAGRLAVDEPLELRSGTGGIYQVFTPFYRRWLELPRRQVLPAPKQLPPLPVSLNTPTYALPDLPSMLGPKLNDQLSPHAAAGGEAAAGQRLAAFLSGPIEDYVQLHDDLAADATSRLSAYLHFGCISPRQIEDSLSDSPGATAFRRQLAWRDFYHYILAHNPTNTQLEFQARYRQLTWNQDDQLAEAWRQGQTGYPVVDAAMRQLRAEGYMHNRARLIVGSFLTKDLGLDWRLGEAHFMRWLTDGDVANNNGNWQWIASVGVDPAPVFRRLYNPTTQATRYDPTGEYIRRYVPELAKVPLEHLFEPWNMPLELQHQCSVVIDQDYPAPIVDHATARQAALERYRQAGDVTV